MLFYYFTVTTAFSFLTISTFLLFSSISEIVHATSSSLAATFAFNVNVKMSVFTFVGVLNAITPVPSAKSSIAPLFKNSADVISKTSKSIFTSCWRPKRQ